MATHRGPPKGWFPLDPSVYEATKWNIAEIYDLKHLIIVCCHGTFTGEAKDFGDESQWILQPFQKSNSATGKPGEHLTFIQHVEAGVRELERDPKALLVFSGGYTADAERSEARGYNVVLEGLRRRDGWYVPLPKEDRHLEGNPPNRRLRVLEEDTATDSYQNLLFSILKFYNKVRSWPKTITVITHAFKERRFLELHAPAIRWPHDQIQLLGIDPVLPAEELEQTLQGEQKAYDLFRQDPYGVHIPLCDKRVARRYDKGRMIKFLRDQHIPSSFKWLILDWKGGESGREVFPEGLPWEDKY